MHRGTVATLAGLLLAGQGCPGERTPSDAAGLDAIDVAGDRSSDGGVADGMLDARFDAPGSETTADVEGLICTAPIRHVLSLPNDDGQGNLFGPSYVTRSNCAARPGDGITGGPDDVYAFHLDVRSLVQFGAVWTDPDAGVPPMNMVLSFRRACPASPDELACVTPTNVWLPTPTPSLARVLEPGDYYAVVDVVGYEIGDTYAYTFSAEPVADNAPTCESAPALAVDGTATLVDFAGAPAESQSCEVLSEVAPQRYFRVTVPAGKVLLVSATGVRDPASGTVPTASLLVLNSCESSACLSSPDFASTNGSVSLRWANNSASDASVLVAVRAQPDDASAGAPRTMVTASLRDPAANGRCDGALELVPGQVFHQTFLLASDSTVSCDGTTRYNDLLWYTATIPAHTIGRLLVSAHGNQPLAYAFSANNCGARTCYNGGVVQPLGSFGNNNTDADFSALLALASTGSTAEFDVEAQIFPPPTNQTCESADALTVDGSTRLFISLPLLNSVVDTPCGPLTNPIFFRATVPASATLSTSATSDGPTPEQNAVIFTGCGTAGTCLSHGVERRPRWTNTDSAPHEVIYAVEGRLGGAAGVNISATTAATLYRPSLIAASCDDLSSGADLPLPHFSSSETQYDDASSDVTALPFSMPFFGMQVSYFAVFTNGLMQLFPDATGMPVFPGTTIGPTTLPNAFSPPGIVAPYWADLLGDPPDAGAGSTIRWQTFDAGGPSAHVTFEWRGWHVGGEPLSTLTFQAKLFENGSVEYHYCALAGTTPSTGVETGGAASIGLQDLSATQGVQYAYEQANAINTTNAIRFDPAP